MERTAPLQVPYDVTVQLQLPNEWDPKLGVYNIGMTAGVETTKCNPEWIDACNTMQRVIVPSRYTESVLKESGVVTTQIDVIPEAYIDSLSNQTASDLLPLPLETTDFGVLIHGQITGANAATDRKNIFNTIKWLCEIAQGKDMPNLVIVLKTNMARNTKIDRMVTTNLLTQLLTQVRRGKTPKVVLLHGDLTDTESAALYRDTRIKALVTLTRGEGFGLPILEAATAGLPVVATGWSAHTEYLTNRYVAIDHQLVDVPSSKTDRRIFMPGAKWAEPSEIDFKNKMKKFISDRSAALRDAESLSDSLRETHSISNIIKTYDTVLQGVV